MWIHLDNVKDEELIIKNLEQFIKDLKPDISTKVKMVNKEDLDKIIKEVVVKNNLHWLHTLDRAEFQYDEGRLLITKADVYEILKKYEEFKK